MASTNETPTYMDRFALHLAKELVGSKTVLQVLQDQLHSNGNKNDSKSLNKKQKSPLLYWRSDFFLTDPSDMIDASQWPCNKNNHGGKHLMYLDAKFEFCLQPKKTVQTTWGCFVLHSCSEKEEGTKYEDYGIYYKSKPMTLQCLEKHVGSMDIDLPEEPQNMAKFMRPALINNKTAKETKEYHIQLKKDDSKESNSNDTKKTIPLELYYKELDEKGVLTVELEEEGSASSPYNELSLEPFYLRELALASNPEESSPQNAASTGSPFGSPTKKVTTPISPAKVEKESNFQLDQALGEWFRHVALVNPKENKKPADLSSPSVVANTNKKRPAKNPQNHGMVRIKKKKKKKGGLFQS